MGDITNTTGTNRQPVTIDTKRRVAMTTKELVAIESAQYNSMLFSPMTSLAYNMQELSTSFHGSPDSCSSTCCSKTAEEDWTPVKRLSLSSITSLTPTNSITNSPANILTNSPDNCLTHSLINIQANIENVPAVTHDTCWDFMNTGRTGDSVSERYSPTSLSPISEGINAERNVMRTKSFKVIKDPRDSKALARYLKIRKTSSPPAVCNHTGRMYGDVRATSDPQMFKSPVSSKSPTSLQSFTVQPLSFDDSHNSDSDSQDSGFSVDAENNPKVFKFPTPSILQKKTTGMFHDVTNLRRNSSSNAIPAKKVTFRQQMSVPSTKTSSSPNAKALHYTRTTSQSGDSSSDDEFLPSLFNLEYDGLVKGVSTNFFDLLNKPVQPQKEKKLTPSSGQIKQLRYNMDDMFKSSEADKENNVPTNEMCKARKGLFRSQSMQPEDLPRYKRLPPCMEDSPAVANKRRCSFLGDESPVVIGSTSTGTTPAVKPTTLHRSFSESEIKLSLNRHDDDPNLIGDRSRGYVLPTEDSEGDLKFISAETMRRLLNDEFPSVGKYLVVDCRYPYEYHGGHITNGKNIYNKNMVMDEFFGESPQWHQVSGEGKRTIIIFHCEFSSERAPRMARFIREQDRKFHKESYPALSYPELYILKGGYKAYFEAFSTSAKHNHTCIPCNYKPMLHENHLEDLRRFRSKAKSWACESRQNRAPARTRLSYRHSLKL